MNRYGSSSWGEDNPYGLDPRMALFDLPERASGHRLRKIVLGLKRSTYLGSSVARHNLCMGRWSAPQARQGAQDLLARYPGVPFVLLGRKVAGAFGRPDLGPFAMDGLLVSIPHPSGLCREWGQPGAVERARSLLREACPTIPWGELTASRVAPLTAAGEGA